MVTPVTAGTDTLIVMVCDLVWLAGEVLSVTVTVNVYELGGGVGGIPDNETGDPLAPPESHDGKLE
jgi:hypothetical protein